MKDKSGPALAKTIPVKALQLTDRDRVIAWAIFDFKVLSSCQIRQMFFGGTPGTAASLSRRMSLLRELGLVEQRRKPGCGNRAYYISGPAAIKEIAAREGKQAGWLYKSHLREAEACMASNHFLAINDVWSAFRLQEQKSMGELVDYSLEPDGRFDFRFRISRNVERVLLVPDGRGVWSTAEGRTTHFLLEVDRGTERLEIIKAKIEKYIMLLLRLGYARVAGRPCFPAVLFIAPSPRRAESIAGCCEAATRAVGVRPQDVARFAAFAVSDMKSVNAQGVLADIWSAPFEGERGKRFDELLPTGHVCEDLRRHFAVENQKWSRAVPTT